MLRLLDSENSVLSGHASADNGRRQVFRPCLPRQRHWGYSLCGFWRLVFPHFSIWWVIVLYFIPRLFPFFYSQATNQGRPVAYMISGTSPLSYSRLDKAKADRDKCM